MELFRVVMSDYWVDFHKNDTINSKVPLANVGLWDYRGKLGLWDYTLFEIGITEISFEIGIMDVKFNQIWIFHPQ